MRTTALLLLALSLTTAEQLTAQPVSSPATGLRTDPSIDWDLALRYRDVSAMAESNGVIVTGNTSGQGGTFAYNAATGQQLWSLPGHIRGGPAASNGFAYAVNDTRDRYRFRLAKLEIKTGKVVWSATAEDLGNPNGPPVLANGQVVLVSRNRVIAAYDDATGVRTWQHEGVRICDGKLSTAKGLVFFSGGLSGSEDMLTALDAKTGRTVWAASPITQEGQRGCGGATAVENGIVAVGIGRDLLAFDAQTGVKRWGRMVAPTVDGQRENMALSQPVVADGVVYAASPRYVLGWNLETGANAFTLAMPAPSELSTVTLVAAGDVLYMAARVTTGTEKSGPAFLYGIDPGGSGVLWRHHVAKPDQYDPVGTWSTRHLLPLKNALIYENSQRLVKLVP